MDVKDVMNTEVVTCSPDTPIRQVAQLLKQEKVSGLPVVDDGKVVGIVSEGDILALLEVPEHGGLWLPSPFEVIEVPIRELLNWEETKDMLEDFGSKPIREIMTKGVYAIGPDSSIEDASTILSKHKINRLPVVNEDGTLVGIVTRGDIIAGLGQL
ncbi:CBS domain-containing protein [Methanolobus bombayensis]|uniref:CBS domain-containing protein n=1 Tax=Methanolobus bombayensis TaxID=38023 RepID=UPI001AE50C59|nr:CBS domain-containing protein [Methanolobus bombayensis]MBP1909284.1 CBS domain-containing protein [Methanolobus bombayensis]